MYPHMDMGIIEQHMYACMYVCVSMRKGMLLFCLCTLLVNAQSLLLLSH